MYNSERLMFAFSALSDDKLERTAIALGYGGQRRRRTPHVRRTVAVAVIAAAFLALGAVAYAADFLGLRTLFANHNRGEMPESAAIHIEKQEAFAETSNWEARILESYCDEGTVLVTLTVTGREDCIVAPTDEGPDSPLWTVGLEGEETLDEYARREGKTLLFAGAVLDAEQLGLSTAGQRFQSLAPNEIQIQIEAPRRGDTLPVTEADCTVYVLPWVPGAANPARPERRTLTVTLAEAGGEAAGVFVPADPAAIPGLLLGELTLTRTPLGLRLRLPITPIEPDALERLLTIRLQEIEFHGAGEIRPEEDGSALLLLSQGQGEAGEQLHLTALDWDKQPIGEALFEKTE